VIARAAAAAAIAAGLVLAPATAVRAAPGHCTQPTGVYRGGTPWPQKTLAPKRIWPLTEGTGVTVAVLGTGVAAGNPQLTGRVLDGTDLTGGHAADSDCDGAGTVAAGMVAAAPQDSTTFAGMAPAATILPIRYTAARPDTADAGPDPSVLAAAIHHAVQQGATVVCVAVPIVRDSPSLRAAVADAHRAGAVVVAPLGTTDDVTTWYPAADPGVLAVAPVDKSGTAVSTGGTGYADVAAPSVGVVAAAPGDGQLWYVKDPSAAAGFVAGAVALLRAYRPKLPPDQVIARIEQTADGTGSRDPKLGWGMIDPYQAVSAELPATGRPRTATPTTVPAARSAAVPTDPRRLPAALLSLGGLALAITLAIAVTVARRGNARRWRPSRMR
jgi:membrane-anchored mycosin MYCP